MFSSLMKILAFPFVELVGPGLIFFSEKWSLLPTQMSKSGLHAQEKNVIYLDESVLNAFTYIQFKLTQVTLRISLLFVT